MKSKFTSSFSAKTNAFNIWQNVNRRTDLNVINVEAYETPNLHHKRYKVYLNLCSVTDVTMFHKLKSRFEKTF